MEKIETQIETNEGSSYPRRIDQDEIVEKINEIVEWINTYEEFQLRKLNS
jgi:hypothetical protein